MNTLSILRLFCDGRTPLQEARSLLISTGHSPEAVQEAINTMINSGVVVTYNSHNETEYNLFFKEIDNVS